MKKYLGIVLAAGMVLTTGHVVTAKAKGITITQGDLTATLNGDAKVQGFWVNNRNGDDDNGFSQLYRIKLDVTSKEGVSFHAREIYSGSRWTGDSHANVSGDVNNTSVTENGLLGSGQGGGDAASLDYGYVQYTKGNFSFSAGRQISNWGFNLVDSDARYDRFLVIQKVGGVSLLGIWDRRADTTPWDDNDNGDRLAVAAIGSNSGWFWGVLYSHWYGGDGYNLRNVDLLSPMVKGKVAGITITSALNYMGEGADSGGSFGDSGSGALFQNACWSGFLRLGYQIGPVYLEGQGAFVNHGGLVAQGFDTFSSIINNSLKNDQNPTSIIDFGGYGYDGDNQTIFAVRASYQVVKDLTLQTSLGYLSQDAFVGQPAIGAAFPHNNAFTRASDLSGTFFDLQAHYKLTSYAELFATFGIIGGDYNSASAPNVGNWAAKAGVVFSF